MAAGLLIFPGAQPSRSRQGTVISAELRWYVNETTTPATVYTDPAMTIPHAFPIVSDDAGRFALIYADQADEFSCTWSTAAPDSQVQSYDFITPSTAEDVVLLDEMNADLADAMEAYESLADVEAAVEEARDYAAEAAAIVAGASGTNTTSSTSLTIGAGTKSLTVSGNLLYVPGMNVALASTVSPSNQMSGIVQSYSPTTGALVVETTATNGSGTFSAWTVSLTGVPYNLASQAEAEAGSDNTKLMTPLRTKEAFSNDWVLFDTVTPLGATFESGLFPTGSTEIAIEFDGVTTSALLVPTMAISSNGAAYGTLRIVALAASTIFNGEIEMQQPSSAVGSISVAIADDVIAEGEISTPVESGDGGYGPLPWRLTAGVRAVKFGLSSPGNYTGGTVRFYWR